MEPIVKHDLASATKLSLWIKVFSEAAASILGTTPRDLLIILQLEDTVSHLQPWNHNSDDPLGINWYLIKETLKKSKYTEKKLGRKITDEDLAKLREVAQVVAKLVDAWGPDNADYATIWLAHGKKVDDLKEFIERFAKDPEKTLQYLEELRQVLHKYIKPKGIKPPAQRTLLSDLTVEKVEVLSILQALEFADYSEKAKEKALQKLALMLEELSKEELTPENLQKIGLVAFAVEIIKRGEFERVEEIKRL